MVPPLVLKLTLSTSLPRSSRVGQRCRTTWDGSGRPRSGSGGSRERDPAGGSPGGPGGGVANLCGGGHGEGSGNSRLGSRRQPLNHCRPTMRLVPDEPGVARGTTVLDRVAPRVHGQSFREYPNPSWRRGLKDRVVATDTLQEDCPEEETQLAPCHLITNAEEILRQDEGWVGDDVVHRVRRGGG